PDRKFLNDHAAIRQALVSKDRDRIARASMQISFMITSFFISRAHYLYAAQNHESIRNIRFVE
ncbi:MAG: hypothetical protein FWF30_05215, partial [Coriobacteriia bacterium]|nr:hypothetical protein [Coriobacteriia bacterium]